jgi:2-oxoglutarate dehydrogenase E2 component (dihydrolipoamide succinyltransferase)
MAQVELIMPKMGESVAEATIIKWLKDEGEQIDAEEAVIEIATDKVDSEIPAPESGVLVKKLFNEDDVVQVGQAIALIETNGAATAAPAAASTTAAPTAKIEEEIQQQVATTTEPTTIAKTGESGRFYSPLVRSIAQKEGISQGALEQIEGSGKNGRVTKKDILAYLENGHAATTPSAPAKAVEQAAAPAAKPAPANQPASTIPLQPGDELIEMDRMRKLIADHMVKSKHTSPHVTSMIEVDVTNIVNWREKNKNAFQQREGEKITFTPIFIEQIVKAIKDMPMINVSLSGDHIIKRKHINIGMATALPTGNLIVPVIKDADQKNLVGLTKSVNDLANRARVNQLKPDEIQDGTFTVTNVGTFGNVMGTPIINQPQVAILALGAIRKKPAVIETPFGDTIGIRQMMFLSMSYDHRVVDGSLGGSFIKKVADYLEAFDPNRDV